MIELAVDVQHKAGGVVKRAWVGGVLVGLYIVSFVGWRGLNFQFSGSHIGASARAVAAGVKTAFHMEAAISPMALFSWVAAAVFILTYTQKRLDFRPEQPVKLINRGIAYAIDAHVVSFIVGVPSILTSVLIEAAQTGAFEWYFERDFWRTSDIFVALDLPVMVLALAGYGYLHGRLGRQTVGQYIVGYVLVPAEGKRPHYFRNGLLTLLGLFSLPIALANATSSSAKVLWWNRKSNLKAVSVVVAD